MSLLEQQSRPDTTPARKTARRIGLIAQGSLFLAAIFIPLLGTVCHWDPAGPLQEKRRLAALPAFPANWKQAKTWTDRYQDFFRDHFGFRATLINQMAWIKLDDQTLHPAPNVITGKKGWYYFCLEDDPNLEASRGLRPFPDPELAVWVGALRRRHAYFASRGIPFLIVIPPDKQTIYPEYLPNSLAGHGSATRLDQLLARLHQVQPDLEILDLRPALLAAKSQDQIYLKTDTHWNDRGAFIAYGQMLATVRRLLPGRPMQTIPISDFDRTTITLDDGDLTILMGLTHHLTEPTEQWKLRAPVPWTVPPEPVQLSTPTILDNPDPGLPRIVMFRDSFMDTVLPMFGRHFSHGVFIWSHAMLDAPIAPEKPDIVISEFVERTLNSPMDSDAPAFRNTPIIPPK